MARAATALTQPAAGGVPPRPAPDRAMRCILRVPERGARMGEERAERLFTVAILLSASRCLLTYVVLPIVTIVLGVATTLAPVIGLPLGIVAIGFDVVGIRRFWLADHRWRWPVTFIYVLVIAFIGVLIALDIAALAR